MYGTTTHPYSNCIGCTAKPSLKKGWGMDDQSNDILPKNMWYDYQSMCIETYRQVSDIRRILVGNSMVDHSDVVGASPVGAAPTTSSFST